VNRQKQPEKKNLPDTEKQYSVNKVNQTCLYKEEVNFTVMKKEISEPKYLEVACQSPISTKSDPEIWELDTNSSTPKRKL